MRPKEFRIHMSLILTMVALSLANCGPSEEKAKAPPGQLQAGEVELKISASQFIPEFTYPRETYSQVELATLRDSYGRPQCNATTTFDPNFKVGRKQKRRIVTVNSQRTQQIVKLSEVITFDSNTKSYSERVFPLSFSMTDFSDQMYANEARAREGEVSYIVHSRLVSNRFETKVVDDGETKIASVVTPAFYEYLMRTRRETFPQIQSDPKKCDLVHRRDTEKIIRVEKGMFDLKGVKVQAYLVETESQAQFICDRVKHGFFSLRLTQVKSLDVVGTQGRNYCSGENLVTIMTSGGVDGTDGTVRRTEPTFIYRDEILEATLRDR